MKPFVFCSVFLFFSCNTPECPETNEQWEKLIAEKSRHKLAYATAEGSSLTIMFDGRGSTEQSIALPIEQKILLEEIKRGFGSDARVADTIINDLPLSYIRSSKGSFVLHSKEWDVVEAEIIEPLPAITGSSVNIGMSKKDFLLIDFKEVDPCFEKIRTISFPYGMNFNEISYSFDESQLTKIKMTDYPD